MQPNTFIARTRKRGEIDYYPARWTEDPKQGGLYKVEFLSGKHKGECYDAIEVAKAL